VKVPKEQIAMVAYMEWLIDNPDEAPPQKLSLNEVAAYLWSAHTSDPEAGYDYALESMARWPLEDQEKADVMMAIEQFAIDLTLDHFERELNDFMKEHA